jgi:cathepsin L
LSEQNLVDCAKEDGSDGCNGGYPRSAFAYIKANHGIDTEKSYPYWGYDGVCHFNKSGVGATDTGFVNITQGSESDLMKAIASIGPISVGIDASQPTFMFYSHGI